jgi:maltose O-acetyltransferase
MLRGEPCLAADPELVAVRTRARQLWQSYDASEHADPANRRELLWALVGNLANGVTVEPPFYCD